MKKFLKENWFIILAALYVLSPLDFLPDVIPGIGQIDDAGVVFAEILRRYFVSQKKEKEVVEAEIIE